MSRLWNVLFLSLGVSFFLGCDSQVEQYAKNAMPTAADSKSRSTNPSVQWSVSTQSTTKSSAATLTVTAQLSMASGVKISLPFSLTGTAVAGTEFTNPSPMMLSFLAGTTSASFKIPILNDGLTGANKTIIVTAGTPINATLGSIYIQTITITNDLLGTFNITGISGPGNVTLDAFLNSGLNPTVNWTASVAAATYDVVIYQNDGVTVKCSLTNTAALSFAFSSCALTAGQTYKASVTAKAAGFQNTNATNNLFSFFVNLPPTVAVIATRFSMINSTVASDVVTGATCAFAGCTISISSSAAAANGTTSFSGNSITYTPAASFTGTDSFSYVISDGRGGTAAGSVNLKVMSPFTWTGAGTDSSWATINNWCGSLNVAQSACVGAAAPGSSNTAIFDGTCSSNCSATLNADPNVQGVKISAPYAGTITQAAGVAMTIGSSGWIQSSGNFVGSNSAMSMGQFSMSGGSFTSTSNTLLMGGSWSITNAPTFTHNSGTVVFSEFTGSIVPGTVQYNHVKFTNGCSYPSFNLNTGTLNVRGNLTFDSTSCGGAGIATNSGTIMTYGNVSTLGGGNGGNAVLTIAGNAGGQTITGVGSAQLPPLTIAAGANAVTLSGSMAINGNYTVTSVGTFTSTGSTLIFYGSSSLQPGTLQYNNVTFASNCTYPSFNLNSSTMNILGNLNLDGTGCSGAFLSTNSGSLMVYGNVTTSGGGAAGTATLVLAGNAGGQTLTGVGGALLPPLTIAAGANPVTFSGSFNVLGNYTVTSVGAFTATGSTIAFSSTGIILPGNLTYNNVTFNSNCSYYTFDLGGTTLKVGGLLYLNGTGCGGAWFGLNSGTVMAYGNVTSAGAGNNGSANLQFVGSGTQILSATNLTGGNVTVANTGAGKVQLASAVSLNGASQSFTVTTGSVDMAGFALTLNSLSLNAKTITRNAGVLTVGGSVVAAGTQSVYGGTVAP